jgi:general secretion pathway protein E
MDARFSSAEAMPDVDSAVCRLLIERGKLDAAGVERAQRVKGEGVDRLHALLIKLGMVVERDVATALAEVLDLPLAAAADYPDEPVLEGALGVKFLKGARVLPLAETAAAVELAMADPLDDFAAQAVALATGKTVQRRVAVPAELESALERLYDRSASVTVDAEGTAEAAAEDAQRLKDMASEAPVIRLVNLFITRAVEARASDIHIEPFENKLRVRFRIDGVLRDIEPPPSQLKAAIVSRVKILAKLNIAERRLPQDGRIKLAIRGKEVDFRVSTLPTMHGESVVLRILDKGDQSFDFAALGFDDQTLKAYIDVIEQPNGILLVTGPTGSGKTTTLYASLLRLNTPEKKILTVEDPVEYQLEGVNQIQVKPQIGLTFASSLRSILRQDPDIVMIGEIRDIETAEIAAQAALTGHLVLSTLHTNSAAASVTRLIDMGLEDYLIASTVIGITAQRLVRRLCPVCREPHPSLLELTEQLDLARFGGDGEVALFRAVGCEACNMTGYRGRSGIAELLIMTEDLRRLTLRRAGAHEIHRAAVESGMRPLYHDGILKALQGMTSLEEVLRVTRES